MKIGVIFSAYQTKEYVEKALQPWIAYWLGHLYDPGAHEVVICAVSVRFTGFDGEDDGTQDILRKALDDGEIHHLIDAPDNIPETMARGMALHWLTDQGCDITWMVDADEVYTVEEIANILTFVDANPWTAWFRISLRNLVFDTRTYLAEPFTPPRIHRVRVDGYRVHSFSADNDIQYGGTITRDIIPQDRFPSTTIPPTVANPRHFSWLNNSRSRAKIRYQLEGRKWPQCSFSWDDSQGGLIFNPALPRPKTITESS